MTVFEQILIHCTDMKKAHESAPLVEGVVKYTFTGTFSQKAVESKTPKELADMMVDQMKERINE